MEVYSCIEQYFDTLKREKEPLNSVLWSVATVPNHKHCTLQWSLSRLPVENLTVSPGAWFCFFHICLVLFLFSLVMFISLIHGELVL